MSRIRQIFLDLDGPVLDGKERHYFCYRAILERFGFQAIDLESYWEMKRGKGDRRELLSLSGAVERYDEFLAAWLELIESPDALELDKVQDGAVDCLMGWKERGIKVALVTMRKDRQALEEQLAKRALHPFFDTVTVCNHADGGVGKADAVRTTCPGSKKSIWVGDTEVDWKAAESLGCPVVLVTNGVRSEEYLRTLEGALVKDSIFSLKDIDTVATDAH